MAEMPKMREHFSAGLRGTWAPAAGLSRPSLASEALGLLPGARQRYFIGAAILRHFAPHRRRMNPNFLDFEQPIAELEGKIQELRHASHDRAFNIDDEVTRLRDKLRHKTAEIFRNLT